MTVSDTLNSQSIHDDPDAWEALQRDLDYYARKRDEYMAEHGMTLDVPPKAR